MEGVVSSRNYSTGDVIYNETAFAKVVQNKFKDAICEFCCKESIFLKACAECYAVKYCGKNCQKNDWSSHRLECKHLKNLPKGPLTDFARLLGKVILKIKDKDWKLITSKVLGKEFSFDDIDSHYKEMTENPKMVLFFNEVKELTGQYIGFENLPDDDSLIKIVGKVRFSSFKTRVIGFFIGTSKFSQECIPNSNATFVGNVIKIWAYKKITKGKDKITIPGRMIILPPIRFAESGSSSCECADCSLPYGESILFKIVDKKRAFSVIDESESFLGVSEAFHNVLRLPESLLVIDRLIREQEGVLGETNYLRMGLLALRCTDLARDPLQTARLLLKLEGSMRSVFGEYYMEMALIYKSLCAINLQLGCPVESMAYADMAMRIEQYSF